MEPKTRRARDPVTGKNQIIPNMTYEEWYNKYVRPTERPKKFATKNTALPTQLGFKDENGLMQFIPTSAEITHVYVIAGNQVSTSFRSVKRLSETYGGNAQDWVKKAGRVESDKYIFDVHWAENPEIGSKKFKIAYKKVKQ